MTNLSEGNHSIKVEAKDDLGNVYSKTNTITVDLSPIVTASPTSSGFSTSLSVSLMTNQPATIYYTINGTTPTTSSPVYSGPILVTSTTTLKYFAVDFSGRTSAIGIQTYTYDGIIPSITATPDQGLFYGELKVT